MKKHPKTAFGILEDGKTLKLASLMRDAGQIYLTDLQLVALDNPLYQVQEQLTDFDATMPAELLPIIDETKVEELEVEFDTGQTINPWNRLFNSVNLEYGVIALNVSDDHIIRGTNVQQSKGDERAFIRTYLTKRQFKAGEWQTSRFKIGSILQFWLHIGINQLLELMKFYARRDKKRLYFQLADANDIALSDFYRIYHLPDNLRVLLVYLGIDYRKALLFDKGELVDVYPLNINQDFPEADMIFSRVSLALDNVQQADPEMTVLCGDQATEEVAEHFRQHGSANTTLLTFPLMIADSTKGYDQATLAQYALPIALAYKALHPDETRFTQSNFLPKYQLEAQKPLKFAWHGFLLIFAIFCLALGGTMSYLHGYSLYSKVNKTKRKLDHDLAVLKVETQEITKMRTEIQKYKENMDAMRTILAGKNPWSEVLDTLNRLLQTRPISWLNNMKKEGSRLHISGTTTNRSFVIDFADALPNSRILKVTNGKIHETNVWNFEITSDFPEVDWVGQIEAEMAAIIEQQKIEEEKLAAENAELPAEEMEVEEEVVEKVPAQVAKKVVVPPPAPATAYNGKQMPPIPSAYMPRATAEQLTSPAKEIDEYNAFINAINKSGMIVYTELGSAYLKNHPEGKLIPLLRWNLAYRLYRTGYYNSAIEILDPLVHRVDTLYPYALLLAARIDFARDKERTYALYRVLEKEYPKHPIQAQVAADIAIIGRGGAQ